MAILHIDRLSIILPQNMASGGLPRGLGASPYIYCHLTSLWYTSYHSKPFTMATGVLMNDSGNISQATPSIGQRAPGVQLHNTSGPRTTPEEVVDRLLERAKSPLGETEVRKVVEALQRVSGVRLLPSCQRVKPADYRYCSPRSK